ncbi:methyltransferase domain-containing protein [Nonomuraea sp. NN258]|uniref:class I SAM-dependent methyltransferase n=1 Tax=Nonomuraea antri TaxID=2730852 RepID=UPI0015691E2F|nr:class I SAM-dependent methyltransferase [Nonomuraea antri]NRQ33944.1 methyltransferase domain-containing protein [Nonomuraea antri]
MDFRTPELDKLAAETVPQAYFELSAEDARDRYFADTRMLDGKQLAHNRFRTNPRTLVDHLLDQLALTGNERWLDLGCGNGFIAEQIRPHLPQGQVVGLDIAPGVLDAARQRLAGVATPCDWIEGSADDLSMFSDNVFDRVTAIYMMHYVPDIAACFREVRRVLATGGRFVVTTDRPDSMVEMFGVHFAAMKQMDAPAHLFKATPKARISLDNGREQLAPYFATVELVTWQDQLRFTAVGPFLDFYAAHNYCCAASRPGDGLEPGFFTELRERAGEYVQQAIDRDGYFAVTKFTGSFVCQ